MSIASSKNLFDDLIKDTPTLEEFTKNIRSKEEGSELLIRKEQDIMNLTGIEDMKDMKSNKSKSKKETCSFINIIDASNDTRKNGMEWWKKQYETCYEIWSQKEEKPEKKKRIKNKLKSSSRF